MKNIKLTKEEKELEQSLENGEWISQPKSEITRYQKMAANYLQSKKKVNRINIRLLDTDILKIKSKAEADGLPYQTLLGSVLHKFANGRLLDVDDVNSVKKLLKFG